MRQELPINPPDDVHDGLEPGQTDADTATPITTGDQVPVDRHDDHEASFRELLMKHLSDFRHYACSMRRSNTRWTGAINGGLIVLSRHGSRQS